MSLITVSCLYVFHHNHSKDTSYKQTHFPTFFRITWEFPTKTKLHIYFFSNISMADSVSPKNILENSSFLINLRPSEGDIMCMWRCETVWIGQWNPVITLSTSPPWSRNTPTPSSFISLTKGMSFLFIDWISFMQIWNKHLYCTPPFPFTQPQTSAQLSCHMPIATADVVPIKEEKEVYLWNN